MSQNPILSKYSSKVYLAYPGWEQKEVDILLKETWNRPLAYDDWTGSKEAPYKGKYITVSPIGFRLNGREAPWPPEKGKPVLFLFGGSTTFGYGLPDNQTIAATLEQLLSKKTQKQWQVYNFGAGFFYSVSEYLLFQRLLVSGVVPDLAIFIDGLNDFYYLDSKIEELPWTKAIKVELEQPNQKRSPLLDAWYGLPMFETYESAKRLGANLFQTLRARNENQVNSSTVSDKDKSARIDSVVERMATIQDLTLNLGAKFNVPIFRIIHPIPFYKYDLSNHPFFDPGSPHKDSGLGYEKLKNRLPIDRRLRNVFWCADIQLGAKELLYIDQVHFSAAMMPLLGACIVQHVNDQINKLK